MNSLSDEHLVETNIRAKKLNLSSDFISIIEKEMERRQLQLIRWDAELQEDQ